MMKVSIEPQFTLGCVYIIMIKQLLIEFNTSSSLNLFY